MNGFFHRVTSAIGRLADIARGTHPEPAWKSGIRRRCNEWIDTLDNADIDNDEGACAGRENSPDLLSFYRELEALRATAKKDARHNHETAMRLEREVHRLTQDMTSLLDMTSRRSRAEDTAQEVLKRKKNALPLVELFDRLKRFEREFANLRFPMGFLPWNTAGTRAAARMREGLAILTDHYLEVLRANGVTKLDTVGKAFDPLTMNGVERTSTNETEAGTVLEEYSGAYLLGDEVLKTAEVRVAKNPQRKGSI